jgi:hypothetical protein
MNSHGRSRWVSYSAYSEGAIPWNEVDAFLERLPAVQAEAAARVTAPRLQFLYGDLGAKLSEIMLILDASKSDVYCGLSLHEVERHVPYHEELSERVLEELARQLGLDDWPKHWHERSIDSRYWPTVRREVREGLIRVAKKDRLDLPVVDEFLANLPAIAAQVQEAWRARLEQISPAAGKDASSPQSAE